MSALLAPFWPEEADSVSGALNQGFLGLGMVLVVARHFFWSVERYLRRLGVKTVLLGEIRDRS